MATELPHPSVVLAKEMQEKAKSCGFAALFADGDRPGGATAAKLMRLQATEGAHCVFSPAFTSGTGRPLAFAGSIS